MTDLQQTLTSHAAWLRGESGGVRAYLRGAALRSADLSSADLRRAALRSADLSSADLSSADLSSADLSSADLSSADLSGANLRSADLSGAYLRGADLSGANLLGANLRSADLSGTCLDPDAQTQTIPDAAIAAAGLAIDGQWVTGRRTARSLHCGATEYLPGSAHVAPWFSTAATACHPGLYLAGAEWLATQYPDEPTVEVRCLRADLLHAGDKWRCRRLWVRCADGSWPEVAGD